MRNAPSVVFPVGRSAFYRWLLVLLGAISLVAWVGWWSTQRAGTDKLWVGLAGIVGWGAWVACAWRSWSGSPIGHLHWDAKASRIDDPLRVGAWHWRRAVSDEGTPLLAVERAVDLQNRMLLCLRRADRSMLWVWVERSEDPVHWNDLRRALAGVRA
jgi:toxin CptA